MDLNQDKINNSNTVNESWEEIRQDLFLHFHVLCRKLYSLGKDGPVPMDEVLCQWPEIESILLDVSENDILDTARQLKVIADHISKISTVLISMLIVANNMSLEIPCEQMLTKLQTAYTTDSLSKLTLSDCITGLQDDAESGRCTPTPGGRGGSSGMMSSGLALARTENWQKLYNLRARVKEMFVELEAIEIDETYTQVAFTDPPMDLSINKTPLSLQLTDSGYAHSLNTLYEDFQPKEMTDEQNRCLSILENGVTNFNINEVTAQTEIVSGSMEATATEEAPPAPSLLPTTIVLPNLSDGKKVHCGAPRGRGRPSRVKFPCKNSVRFLKKVKKNACAKPMTTEQIHKLTLKLKCFNLEQVWQLLDLVDELEPEYKRKNNPNGSATYDLVFFRPATLHHIKRFANACLRHARKIADEQKVQETNTDGDGKDIVKDKDIDSANANANPEKTAQNVKEPICLGSKVTEGRRPTRKQTQAQFFKWKKLSDSSGSSDDSD